MAEIMTNLRDFFSLVAEEEKKKKIELENKLQKALAEQEVIGTLSKLMSQLSENKPEIPRDEILDAEIVGEQVVVSTEQVASKNLVEIVEANLGLIGGTTTTKTSDPLTPLDQKFVTFDDLQNHYKTYIARIQQQMSTMGGGGETKLRYLDDIDRPTIDNGMYLQYNAETTKFQFAQAAVAELSVARSTDAFNPNIVEAGLTSVITDMTLFPGTGRYLVTYSSEYTVDKLQSVTQVAADDLLALYNTLMALTPTVTNHAPTFGNETLAPGIYTIAGAMNIVNTLTLDAGGNPKALFVFRCTGAFTTGASSVVRMINGGTTTNVWWVSEGAASTGAQTAMIGSMLTNQAAVSTGANTNINGRLLAINGAVTLGDTTTMTQPTGVSRIDIPVNTIALFSLFAAVGAISNTGPSRIPLSIGTNAGSITGFEPATVLAPIYPAGVDALGAISFGIYVDGELIDDSYRTSTNEVLVAGRTVSLQAMIDVIGGQEVDIRTTVPIGEYTVGPSMSMVLLLTQDSGGFIGGYGGTNPDAFFKDLDDVNIGTMTPSNDNWVLEYDAETETVQFTEDVGEIRTIKLNTAGTIIAPIPGMLSWNPLEDCLDITQSDGSTLQTGLESYVRVHNASGFDMQNGDVVRFGGILTDIDGTPLCELMTADENQQPLFLMGLLTNDLPNGATGRATVLGNIRSLDTTGAHVGEVWESGDILWVHPSISGEMTKYKPTAPDLAISVAVVMIVDLTFGKLLVKPNFAPRQSYGTFLNTGDHVAADINTPTNIPIDLVVKSRGFTLTGTEDSRITATVSGLYNFTVSYQITSTNAASKDIYFWMRRDGIDLPFTTRKKSIVGNGVFDTFACTWSVSLLAGQYAQLMWAVSSVNVILEAVPTLAFAPSSPAVILTITEAAL